MDISLSELFDCVDADQNSDRSVLFSLFGFRRGLVPPEPDASTTASVSVRQLAGDLEDDHIHLNVIAVGIDVLSADGEKLAEEELDYSVYRIRNIFRPQGVGVGRVLNFEIDDAEAGDFGNIADGDEAENLWQSYYVDNDGIDAFVSRFVDRTVLLGRSPVGGDCGKQSNDDGLLGGGVNDDAEGLSRTFAHEVGHFLGLSHNHDALPGGPCPNTVTEQMNLMAQTGCIPLVASGRDTRGAVLLTSSQGNTMDDHCTVQEGC